jgi:ER lumen protein retaining receptor
MITKKTCSGVSLKTQLLYLVVFCTRYVNMNILDPPLWNIFFKFFYIGSQILIIVLMLTKLKGTYDWRHDTFRIVAILLVCLPAAWFSRPRAGSLFWFLYAYSLWVEVLAILPQMMLLGSMQSKRLDVLNREYIFFLSIYRLFYLLNWAHKWVTKAGYTPRVLWITGILQTVIYADFIWVYVKMKITGVEFHLPY